MFYLSKILIESPIRPVAAIIGGAKVSTKLKLLYNLMDKVDKLLIGGAMAFTFYRAIHLSVGDSLVEESMIRDAANIISSVSSRRLILKIPTDIVVAPSSYIHSKSKCKKPQDLEHLKERHLQISVVPHDEIPIGWMGLDIGPETIRDSLIELESCNTILWNGKKYSITKFSDLTVVFH